MRLGVIALRNSLGAVGFLESALKDAAKASYFPGSGEGKGVPADDRVMGLEPPHVREGALEEALGDAAPGTDRVRYDVDPEVRHAGFLDEES